MTCGEKEVQVWNTEYHADSQILSITLQAYKTGEYRMCLKEAGVEDGTWFDVGFADVTGEGCRFNADDSPCQVCEIMAADSCQNYVDQYCRSHPDDYGCGIFKLIAHGDGTTVEPLQ